MKIDYEDKRYNKRNSSFELLRIIAMMTIISFHYFLHGIRQLSFAPPVFWFASEISGLLAKISNNVFFLLTGWFLVKYHFTFKRLMILLGQILFINWSLLLVNITIYGQRDTVTNLKQLFPISSNMNWFVTAYFAVYMLGPFIQNAAIYFRKRPQKYSIFIFVLFILLGLFGFITPSAAYYSGITFGIYIVFIGDYVEFNKDRISNLPIKTIGLVCFIMLICLRFALEYVSNFIPVVSNYVGHFEGNASPLITITAVCVLLSFSKISFKSKIINIIASSTLTVYLIHDNGAFKKNIWFFILKLQNHLEHMYVYMIYCVFMIYLCCFVIDQIRMKTLDKVWNKIISSTCSKLDKYLEKIVKETESEEL